MPVEFSFIAISILTCSRIGFKVIIHFDSLMFLALGLSACGIATLDYVATICQQSFNSDYCLICSLISFEF